MRVKAEFRQDTKRRESPCESLSQPSERETELPAEDFREHQRRNDGGVGLDDISRSMNAEFSPRDFLVGHGAGVRSETGGGIADLTEITPFGYERADYVLIQHRHNTDRKIAGDATADLKEADGRVL